MAFKMISSSGGGTEALFSRGHFIFSEFVLVLELVTNDFRIPLERDFSTKEFVQHGSQTIDVPLRGRFLAFCPFGSHISRRPDPAA